MFKFYLLVGCPIRFTYTPTKHSKWIVEHSIHLISVTHFNHLLTCLSPAVLFFIPAPFSIIQVCAYPPCLNGSALASGLISGTSTIASGGGLVVRIFNGLRRWISALLFLLGMTNHRTLQLFSRRGQNILLGKMDGNSTSTILRLNKRQGLSFDYLRRLLPVSRLLLPAYPYRQRQFHVVFSSSQTVLGYQISLLA